MHGAELTAAPIKSFHEQIEDARKMLHLPTDASPYEVMCANAAAEEIFAEALRCLTRVTFQAAERYMVD